VSHGESYPFQDRGGQGETETIPKESVSDADLEAAIVRAVTLGSVDVARVLAAQLEERRRARSANVIRLDSRKRT
jgi:hypothetical protein